MSNLYVMFNNVILTVCLLVYCLFWSIKHEMQENRQTQLFFHERYPISVKFWSGAWWKTITTLIGLTKLFSPVKCKYRLNYICTSSRPLELDILSFDFYCLEKQLFLQELLVFCFCFEWKLDAVYSLEYVRVQTDIKSREKWYQRKRQTTHPCWLVVEISRFWLLKGNIYFHSRYFS
jgi:hypothetical protein